MTETPTAQTTTRVHRFSFASFGDEQMPLPKVTEKLAQEKNAAPAAPVEPPPPPPPVITEKDVHTARAEGHAKGYAEGTQEAEAKINKDATAREESVRGLLDVIANRITIAAEGHIAYLKEQEAMMGKLIIAIARKLSGEALKAAPLANVETLLHECMALIAGNARIVVTVSPARSVDLKRRLDTIKSHLQGFDGELQIEESATIGEEDCRVEWKDGYAEYNADSVWKSVEAIVVDKTLIKDNSEGDAHG